LKIENADHFDFSSVRLAFRIRDDDADDAGTWQMVSLDKSGSVWLVVPNRSVLFLEFKSLDGSLRLPSDVFYSLVGNEVKTVLRDSVKIEANKEEIDRLYVLKAGSAVSICSRDFGESGHVQFFRIGTRVEDEVSIFSFAEFEPTPKIVLGGIEPGVWQFSLVGSDGKTLRSVRVDLINLGRTNLFC